MHKQRIGMLIAAMCGMAATFLPWIKAPFIGSIPGSEATEGWLSFGSFGIACLLTLLGDRSQLLDRVKMIAAMIAGGVAALLAILKIMDLRKAISASMSENPFAGIFAPSVSIGIGLYVIIGAAAAIVAAGLILKGRQE